MLTVAAALASAGCGGVQAGDTGAGRPWAPGSAAWIVPAQGGSEGELFFQCWREDGTVVAKSEELGEASLPRLAQGLDEPLVDWITIPDGRRARAVALRVEPTGDAHPLRSTRLVPLVLGDALPTVEVVVASEATVQTSTLQRLGWLLLSTWITVSLVSAGVLAWLVGRGLRPLEDLREQIDRLDEARLDQRMSVAGAPVELAPVVDHLNALLGRLGAAFEREQAFSAHAAHELRTPIAGLRSTLEVALLRPRTPEQHRAAAEQCLAITKDMQSMVETLLDLARLAAEPEREPCTAEELAALVDEEWGTLEDDARERGLGLDVDLTGAPTVATDLSLLRRIVANVLTNAVDYADPDSRIEVSASAGALVFSNAAATATPAMAAQVFEPFWRADTARSDTGRHAGLGLALCRRIAELLGGSVSASVEAGEFRLRLVLPRA